MLEVESHQARIISAAQLTCPFPALKESTLLCRSSTLMDPSIRFTDSLQVQQICATKAGTCATHWYMSHTRVLRF